MVDGFRNDYQRVFGALADKETSLFLDLPHKTDSTVEL